MTNATPAVGQEYEVYGNQLGERAEMCGARISTQRVLKLLNGAARGSVSMADEANREITPLVLQDYLAHKHNPRVHAQALTRLVEKSQFVWCTNEEAAVSLLVRRTAKRYRSHFDYLLVSLGGLTDGQAP